ncbi:hypothetical protein BJ085DRAFT_34719 [Dimargaris cristalligena]|uniref:Uncharacterized protein n=1 Tax=Dimargaris cristalligena TaxID=215637 RepID=A0A4V1J3T0_9FUNG|nr:hypothetical protein BJ085DRAFT_34719 [Dimargaris cristalligena]|eukprot:RKP33129.1 hypothetical protein BJ085DRAFT_34719 [Dimargaris cristalligena]
MINESTFLTGGDSGAIALWSTGKKKPLFVHFLAHGADGDHDDPRLPLLPTSSDSTSTPVLPGARPVTPFKPELMAEYATAGTHYFPHINNPRWITALAVLPFSDLFVTGSWDGHLRLWQLDARLRSFSLLTTIPMVGFVNALQFAELPTDALEEQVEAIADGSLDKDNKDGPLPLTPSLLKIVAGVGQEPKLGRWLRIKEARNSIQVIPLPTNLEFTANRKLAEEHSSIFGKK